MAHTDEKLKECIKERKKKNRKRKSKIIGGAYGTVDDLGWQRCDLHDN